MLNISCISKYHWNDYNVKCNYHENNSNIISVELLFEILRERKKNLLTRNSKIVLRVNVNKKG